MPEPSSDATGAALTPLDDKKVTVELGYTPASLNKLSRTTKWAVFHRHKTALQNDIELMLLVPLGAGFRLERVHAEATLRFPSRRRRDEGNYRALLEKALGDALTGDVKAWPEGRWLVDDTPEHFTFGAVEFEIGPSSTELRLSCTPAQPRRVG